MHLKTRSWFYVTLTALSNFRSAVRTPVSSAYKTARPASTAWSWGRSANFATNSRKQSERSLSILLYAKLYLVSQSRRVLSLSSFRPDIISNFAANGESRSSEESRSFPEPGQIQREARVCQKRRQSRQAQAQPQGRRSALLTRMEDFTPMPPSLRRYYTDEPTAGSHTSVKKARALYLSKTLEEKAEEARWYRQDVVDLADVLTWPEYADEVGLEVPATKKPIITPVPHLNNKISLFHGDITKLDVDVIVNAANSSLLGGGGVDGAIHRAAGSHLLQECRGLRGCEIGDAKLTAGYLLPARYVLHTVGPMVHGPVASLNHREGLSSCYQTCLQRIAEHNRRSRAKTDAKRRGHGSPASSAKGEPGAGGDRGDRSNGVAMGAGGGGGDGEAGKPEEGAAKTLGRDLDAAEPQIRSVAFPCISTGVYGYPQEDACQVALGAVKVWLEENPDEVDRILFCVYLQQDLRYYEKYLLEFFPLDGTSSSTRNEDEGET